MRRCRLHVMGASGSGTTTLARTLASWWSVPHADADTGRSLRAHEEWLAEVGRPVLTLDSAASPDELRDAVLAWDPRP